MNDIVRLSTLVNIYVDESCNDNFYFISLVLTAPTDEKFWAQEIEEILKTCEVKEIHGKSLPDDYKMQEAVWKFLVRFYRRAIQDNLKKRPLAFCILAIKKDSRKQIDLFGRGDCTTNMHRRLLRSAVKYALKKFCGMSQDRQLTLMHFYHDENSLIEGDILLRSPWMISKLISDCDFNLEAFAEDKIQFISSVKETSNLNASYLIQVADLLAWLIQKGEAGVDTTSRRLSSYRMKRIFDYWSKKILPPLLFTNWDDIKREIDDVEKRQELYQHFYLSNLSFFPDDQGQMYKPDISMFNYGV